MSDFKGKTIVVTGGTSGIGLAACEAWAQAGARLVIVGRDQKRLDTTLDTLAALGSGRPAGLPADLQSLTDVRRLADGLLSTCPRIDVLFLNAGAIFAQLSVTPNGVEKTFAVNHLAPFFLTHLLWDRLIASSARVIVTASTAHRYARRLDLGSVVHPRTYTAFGAYGRSKLANILFAGELARRMAGTGVTAFSFHPGVVATRFAQGTGWIGAGFKLLQPFLRSPKKAAETALYLATSPDLLPLSGRYFTDCKPARTTRLAQDTQAARQLWAFSRTLCGLPPEAGSA